MHPDPCPLLILPPSVSPNRSQHVLDDLHHRFASGVRGGEHNAVTELCQNVGVPGPLGASVQQWISSSKEGLEKSGFCPRRPLPPPNLRHSPWKTRFPKYSLKINGWLEQGLVDFTGTQQKGCHATGVRFTSPSHPKTAVTWPSVRSLTCLKAASTSSTEEASCKMPNSPLGPLCTSGEALLEHMGVLLENAGSRFGDICNQTTQLVLGSPILRQPHVPTVVQTTFPWCPIQAVTWLEQIQQ